MNFNMVRLLLGKEMREILRDKRTLFVMLFMPFVSYPLIIILMTQLALTQTKKIEEKPARIAVASRFPAFVGHV